MSPRWLPEHQVDVALTLGHADEVTGRLCDLLFDYTVAEPLGLTSVSDEEMCYVTVTSVAPLPPAVARLAADALTQLRAAIDHAVYAEVEVGLGRPLTVEEERRVEMPATTTPEGFADWLKRSRRRELPPLREGSDLVKRISSLQPYHRKDADQHPLRVLAEHTNLAKHRTPAVATVQLALVNTWPLNNPDLLVGTRGTPLEVGTVVASGPKFKQIPIDIWSQVAIRRPHTGEWMVLVKEIGSLAEWVRTVAIPVVATGDANSHPPLPPHIDTARGWASARDAIGAAGPIPADVRHLTRLQAHTGRRDLPEILALHPEPPAPEVIQQWVDGLTDAEVLAELNTFSRTDPLVSEAAARAMIRKAQEAYRLEE